MKEHTLLQPLAFLIVILFAPPVAAWLRRGKKPAVWSQGSVRPWTLHLVAGMPDPDRGPKLSGRQEWDWETGVSNSGRRAAREGRGV